MPRNRANRRLASLTALVALAAALLAATPAVAAVRYASPTSLDTVGACSSTAPCRIDHAVGGAASGDEVVVMPGDYTLTYEVRAQADVHIRAKSHASMPRLIGVAGLSDPTLEMDEGGKVSGLYLENGAGTALRLARGARGDGLIVVATGVAPAVHMESSPTPTVLVNSVVQATGTESAVNMVDGSGPAGGATLVNVTAIATGTGAAVASETSVESAVLRNVIARATGTGKDLEGASGSLGIDVAHSNFRPSASANWIDGGKNQVDVAPNFVNEPNGDYRETGGSPTIDAGTPHPLVDGTSDPDGRARLLGAAPDIGAFEHQPRDETTSDPVDPPIATDLVTPILDTTETSKIDPAAAPTGSDATPGLPAPAPPVLGTSVGVENSGGLPLVQLPGSTEYVPLTAGASIPVGSTVDTTRGTVTLTSVRDAGGEVQTGTFWGGAFKVRQSSGRKPVTELALTGGDFSRCGRSRSAGKAASTARARHSARIRRLWGRDRHGRFRTRGRRSHATVRGTAWLVQDRCDGTLTKVKEGAVVVRDFQRRRSTVVRAGGRYFARAR